MSQMHPEISKKSSCNHHFDIKISAENLKTSMFAQQGKKNLTRVLRSKWYLSFCKGRN